MNRKLLCASIAALLTLSIMATIPNVGATVYVTPPPLMWVEPPTTTKTALGQQFTIAVMVDDIPQPGTPGMQNGGSITTMGCSGIEMKLGYDPALLDVVSFDIDPAGWLAGFTKTPLEITLGDTDPSGEAGYIGLSYAIIEAKPGGYAWTATPQPFAIITFEVTQAVLYPGTLECPLHLYDAIIYEAGTGDLFAATLTDGLYKFIPPAPVAPTAAFSWTPLSPVEGEAVTFDASASTPNGGSIIEYSWNFGDGNTTSVAIPKIIHTYTTANTYNVILTVYDSEGMSSAPLTKPITVRKPAVGLVVDIYTNKEAEGPGMGGKGPASETYGPPTAAGHSDSFEPGELVILTAEVTYNGDPVAGMRVTFFLGTTESAYTYFVALATEFEQGIDYLWIRSNVTSLDGKCTVSYRIPIPVVPEYVFGHYLALAGTEVAGTIKFDWLTFNVGWIVDFEVTTMAEVSPGTYAPATNFYKTQHVHYYIEAKNIAFVPKTAIFWGVVQDEGGQTISGFYWPTIIPGAPYHPIFGFALLEPVPIMVIDSAIPIWALIGEAVVYVNAFNVAWGAYCREKALPIYIVKL